MSAGVKCVGRQVWLYMLSRWGSRRQATAIGRSAEVEKRRRKGNA